MATSWKSISWWTEYLFICNKLPVSILSVYSTISADLTKNYLEIRHQMDQGCFDYSKLVRVPNPLAHEGGASDIGNLSSAKLSATELNWLFWSGFRFSSMVAVASFPRLGRNKPFFCLLCFAHFPKSKRLFGVSSNYPGELNGKSFSFTTYSVCLSLHVKHW